MKENLILSKKGLKGEDGHRTFSVRIRQDTVNRLDDLAKQTGRSRNDLINRLLAYALDHCEVEERSST